jgi:hypothetical protein
VLVSKGVHRFKNPRRRASCPNQSSGMFDSVTNIDSHQAVVVKAVKGIGPWMVRPTMNHVFIDVSQENSWWCFPVINKDSFPCIFYYWRAKDT